MIIYRVDDVLLLMVKSRRPNESLEVDESWIHVYAKRIDGDDFFCCRQDAFFRRLAQKEPWAKTMGYHRGCRAVRLVRR